MQLKQGYNMAIAFWELAVVAVGAGIAIWLFLKWKGIDITDSLRSGEGGGGW